MHGNDVSLMDNYDYGKHVWGGRTVDPTDICDEWNQKQPIASMPPG
jgi:hypothetical protein